MSEPVCATVEQFALPHPSGEGQLCISVSSPSDSSAAPTPVPVLYVVDGDLMFGLAAEISRILASVEALPTLTVVGIGYGAGYAEVLKRRTADLSPPLSAHSAEKLGSLGAAIGSDRQGGADAFLAFLVDHLAPEIAARCPPTAGGRQFLFGHSLGGLFAAHALLTRPQAFSAYLISSPSLWWNDFSIFPALLAFADRIAGLKTRPRVFVNVGGKEQDPPESVPEGLGVTLEEARAHIAASRMVDAAREFAEALRGAGVSDLRHIAFGDEDHVSAAPAGILHGIRFALGR